MTGRAANDSVRHFCAGIHLLHFNFISQITVEGNEVVLLGFMRRILLFMIKTGVSYLSCIDFSFFIISAHWNSLQVSAH